jgi:acetyl esterase
MEAERMASDRRADSLHPEAQTVIDLLEEADVPPVHALSVTGARERMGRLFVAPEEPEPVAAVDDFYIQGPASDLPVRAYTPAGGGEELPILVWYHGGGFVLGDLETTDPACRALANACGAIVLSVDYRLAPEHPWPAPPADCYAAAEWACEHGDSIGGDTDRVAVGGSSAGGNLAAGGGGWGGARGAGPAGAEPARGPGRRAHDGPDVAHQMLIYPAVHNDLRGRMPSYEENGEGYLLERADSEWFHEHYLAREQDAYHPHAFPLQARSLADLPPATVLTAGFDPLRDEGFAYAERLKEAGVDVVHRNYDDTIHGFFGMVGERELEHARAAIEDVSEDFREFV